MNLHYQESNPHKNTTFQPLRFQIYSVPLHISVNHGDRLQVATKCKHKRINAIEKASALQPIY